MGRGKGFGTVSVTANGRYAARFSHQGVRHSAGVTFATEEEARDYLATVKADIIRNVFKADAPDRRGAETLREYAIAWLVSRDLKPATRQRYASKLDNLILPTLGDARLRDITPKDIRTWHASLQTGATAKAHAYRILRTILGQAVKDDELDRNPCNVPGAGTPKTAKRPTLTAEDVVSIADEAPDHLKVLILLAGFSGLRSGELVALERQDILMPPGKPMKINVTKAAYVLDDRTRVVSAPKTEAGTRTVTLPEFLRDELAAHLASSVYPDSDALVFTNTKGQPLNRHSVQHAFKKAALAHGITGAHFHDLRHTAGTLAAQSGASLTEVMSRLGHASKDMALIYLHATQSRDEAIASAIDAMAPASLRRASS